MDELEFRKQAYAAPSEPDQELLDAAKDDFRLQTILDEARQLDTNIGDIASSVVVPEGLKDRLLNIPDSDTGESDVEPSPVTMRDRPVANSSFFHYYAIAAGLLLVIGVTYTLSYDSGPTSAELAMGSDVITHMYEQGIEMALVNSNSSRAAVAWDQVDTVMAHVDAQLRNSISQQITVFYANPCIIYPEYSSSHLMMEGNKSIVNVFVVLNNPVSSEFQFGDQRFHGLVSPMDQGNLILLAENGEDLGAYKEMLAENITWVL